MKPTFKAQPMQVQVPATSANLGPGFDALGLALTMHDRYIAQVLDEPGVDIDVAGEGTDDVPRTDKNLVIKAMYKGFDFLGGKPRGIALRQLNVIPHGRGLGSSASAIVGGLSLARALVLGGNERMSDEEMLVIASEMEGHPDNVAAAIYGNANIAWQETQRGHLVAQAVKIEVDARIGALAFIPSTSVATSKARKMLPESIPHADAVRNSTNAALLVHSLQHRPDLLHTATGDYLHQIYRQDAMPHSFALLTKLRDAGVAAFISGAGPTVLALHTGGPSEAEELRRAAGDKFIATELGIARTGASVISA
ncbi:MAG: homoserine kinase [Actinobacteria bacterium]|uniref:Homoserine kinase n=1 Tax=freshwater metagenome TaxID=449393 RepID=A0A6J6WE20_9ZZZZ|nr:homoserine kinase [Actinomycetota bacterium]